MKIVIATLLALSLASTAFAQVYKTTDENGRTVYTDRPSDKAETVEMRETNTAPPVTVRPFDSPTKAKSPADSIDYRVRITSPENETHLPPGERNLTIAFTTNQPLAGELRAQALSNGAPVGSSTTGSSVFVPEMERGEHQISIIIFDTNDNILAQSEPITVYVHRSTAPKPTPKPTPRN